jgi:hypothetical protein
MLSDLSNKNFTYVLAQAQSGNAKASSSLIELIYEERYVLLLCGGKHKEVRESTHRRQIQASHSPKPGSYTFNL